MMIADCHPFPVAVRPKRRQVTLSGFGRGRWRPAFARFGSARRGHRLARPNSI